MPALLTAATPKRGAKRTYFFFLAAFFLAGAFFLAAAFFLAGAFFFLADAFFLAGAFFFLAAAFFLAGAFFFAATFFLAAGFFFVAFFAAAMSSLLMCPASSETLSSFIFDDKQSRANYYLTQCRHYVARYVVNSTHAIELVIVHVLEFAIKIDQGTRLIVIDRQPVADRIFLIVVALN